MTGITTSASLRSAGTFALSWIDVLVDDVPGYPPSELGVGQEVTLTEWSQRLDGPGGQLLLRGGVGVAELHARAARIARVISRAEGLSQPALPDPDDTLLTGGMLLTDGHTSYHCTLLQAEHLLLVFHGRSPAPGDTLWIVRLDGPQMPETEQVASPGAHPAVVCFAAGTQIATPNGRAPVETLREGDLVLTRDNGPMPIRWRGQQRLSAARLIALPHLRPIRIEAGALGLDRPESQLLLSPDHRVMVSGPAAAALFGVRDVLIRAGDLQDAPGVRRTPADRDVTYVHLALDGHQILDAAGLPVESFDPASADLRALAGEDRARLFEEFPALRSDNAALGPPARRVLKTSEAAILGHRLQ